MVAFASIDVRADLSSTLGSPSTATLSASATTYSAVYVLGDSLVDAGNALGLAQFAGSLPFVRNPENAPTSAKGYFAGRFSDGYTYADLLANTYVGTPTKPVFPYGFDYPVLGIDVPLAPWAPDPKGNALNFAYGGAQVIRGKEVISDLDEQTDALKGAVDHRIDPNALVLCTIGGNDVRELVSPTGTVASLAKAQADLAKSASKLLTELNQLVSDGARHLVVTGIPDVGLIPKYDVNGNNVLDMTPVGGTLLGEFARASAATQYSAYFDNLVRTQVVPAVEAKGAVVTYVPLADVVGPGGQVIERGALDLVLPTIAARNGLSTQELRSNILQHRDLLFFDDVHPNAQVHALVGSYIQSRIDHTPWIETMPLTGSEIRFSMSGTIAVVGEEDRHMVKLKAGQTYTVEVLGLSTLGGVGCLADPSLTIEYRKTGPISGFTANSGDDCGLGLDASYTFTAQKSGKYYFTVSGEGALTGDYILQVGIADPLRAAAATDLFAAAPDRLDLAMLPDFGPELAAWAPSPAELAPWALPQQEMDWALFA